MTDFLGGVKLQDGDRDLAYKMGGRLIEWVHDQPMIDHLALAKIMRHCFDLGWDRCRDVVRQRAPQDAPNLGGRPPKGSKDLHVPGYSCSE